jgi:hypothetical protein
VQPDYGIGVVVIEKPFGDHRLGSAHDLLGGLKYE